jgi:transcriptional regulator with XRE-family HTH domain
MIVRKLRLKRGWSQEQLAELTGLNVRTIQRVERGNPARLETRNALAAVFEVEASVFEQETGSMNGSNRVAEDEAEAFAYVQRIREFWTLHVGMFVVFALVFGFSFGLEHPLIRWGIIGWGIAMVVHGLCVYEVINLFGPDWERRLVEKRLGRKL